MIQLSGRPLRAVLPVVVLGLVAAPRPGAAQAEVTLEVAVTSLETSEGLVRVALYDDASGFTDAPARSATLAAGSREEGEALVWTVHVPPGMYAVAAIHDRNGNGRLDANFLGMPKEPYGFSNGARGRLGPPSFEEAAFTIGAPSVRVRVAVR